MEDLSPDDSLVIYEVGNESLNDVDRFHGPIMSQHCWILLVGFLDNHQEPRIRGNNYNTTASWKTFSRMPFLFDGLKLFI